VGTIGRIVDVSTDEKETLPYEVEAEHGETYFYQVDALELVETKTNSIKDSGDRTQFYDANGNEIGRRDMHEGKGRLDLMPCTAILELAKHCEAGALKYGERNVDKGIPIHSFLDSAFRHLAKFMEGWTDEQHLRAAAWNILWAIQTLHDHPYLLDIPKQQEKEKPSFGRCDEDWNE
jgi:hypothetical protein